MTGNPHVQELNRRLEAMTALDALRAGLVCRTVPEYTCGSTSPGETLVVCRLEPGHDLDRGHEGPASFTIVSWAPTQDEFDERALIARTRE